MAKELKTIDITNNPDLLRLAEEVRTTNEPWILRRDREDLVIVRPLKRSTRPRIPRGKPFTKDDSLFNLIGIAPGRDDGIHDVSENVDKYLAEAYADTHE